MQHPSKTMVPLAPSFLKKDFVHPSIHPHIAIEYVDVLPPTEALYITISRFWSGATYALSLGSTIGEKSIRDLVKKKFGVFVQTGG